MRVCAVTNWTPDRCRERSKVEMNIYEAIWWRRTNAERMANAARPAVMVDKIELPPEILVLRTGTSGGSRRV